MAHSTREDDKNFSLLQCTRNAPKVIPILLCWPSTPKADVGVVAVAVELSHQHSIPFCCQVSDGSGMASDMEVPLNSSM